MNDGVVDAVFDEQCTVRRAPARRLSALYSFSVNNNSDARRTRTSVRPVVVHGLIMRDGAATASVPSTALRDGRRASSPQAHVLRNHSVGRRYTGAGSGPRLVASIRSTISSERALAYSTVTLK